MKVARLQSPWKFQNYEIVSHPQNSHAMCLREDYFFSPVFCLGNCSDHVSFITSSVHRWKCLFLERSKPRNKIKIILRNRKKSREKKLLTKKSTWFFFWETRRSLKAKCANGHYKSSFFPLCSERQKKYIEAAKMFKNHLAMIGYNESPNKKAKFWQSYIRSLKGELKSWKENYGLLILISL